MVHVAVISCCDCEIEDQLVEPGVQSNTRAGPNFINCGEEYELKLTLDLADLHVCNVRVEVPTKHTFFKDIGKIFTAI